MSHGKAGRGWRMRGYASQYTTALKEQLQKAKSVVVDNMREAQLKQEQQYDKNAREWEFQVVQRVLVLLPISTSKFLCQPSCPKTCWQGPFHIVYWVVLQPGHRYEKHFFLVNLL